MTILLQKFDLAQESSTSCPDSLVAMKMYSDHSVAYTRAELLVTTAIVFVLFVLVSAPSSKAKARAQRINCTCNLKAIGETWRLAWQGGKSSASLSNIEELNAMSPDAGYTYQFYGTLSNELNMPKFLICPADERAAHTNFGMLKGKKSPGPYLNNTTVSYFVGRDAQEAFPQMLLSGDRNIAAPNYATDYGYSPAPNIANGNFVAFGTNDPAAWWTSKMHNKQGNVLFADGHVEGLSSSALREHLRFSGDTNQTSNAILFP